MIDIHAHIIPQLDDGPRDIETSVALGMVAQREGIRTIVSTSHSEEAAAVGREGMLARLKAVKQAWRSAGLEIELELGVEIFLRPDTASDLQSGHLWTLAGSKYVLVELPYQPWPTYAEEALFSLRLAGYVPILAHPERYTAIQADPGKMHELAQRGVLAQVTAGALLRDQGAHVKKSAETLIKHNLVQFIASDAHSATWRSPHVREALLVLEDMVGTERMELMSEINPARLLANQEIAADPIEPARRKGFMQSLFGR